MPFPSKTNVLSMNAEKHSEFIQIQVGLSEIRPLSREALYHVLVKVLGLTRGKFPSLWPYMPGLKYLTNDKASLSWLMIRDMLWVVKKILRSTTGHFARVYLLQ